MSTISAIRAESECEPNDFKCTPIYDEGTAATLALVNDERLPVKKHRCRRDAEHIASFRRTMLQRAAFTASLFAALVKPDAALAAEAAPSKAPAKMTQTESGLKFLDVVVGTGREVEGDSRVTFHYIGRLAGRQGKPFEASKGGNTQTHLHIMKTHTHLHPPCA